LTEKTIELRKAFALFCGILIAVTIVSPLFVMRICSMLWQASTLFIGPYMVYYLIKQIKKGNKEGVYLIAGLIMLNHWTGLLDMATLKRINSYSAYFEFCILTFHHGHCGDNGK
jgi:hypothetical protein